MNIPDGLPTLSAGGHAPHSGEASFMEYVSLLAGEQWSAMPKCMHPVIAWCAMGVNDHTAATDRHRLTPLVPSVVGTSAGDYPGLSKALESWAIGWSLGRLNGLGTERSRRIAEYVRLVDSVYDAGCAMARFGFGYEFLSALIAEHARLTGHVTDPAVEAAWNDTD